MTSSEPLATHRTAEDYRSAIDSSTDADRAYASSVSTHVVELVKAFSSIKAKLDAQGGQDRSDFLLLVRLAREGPMRASDLAELLGLDPSTVSRQVAALVKAKLIKRQSDPKDGRASILVPTAAGREVIEHHLRVRGMVMAPLIASWSPADRDTFVRLLAEFTSAITENVDTFQDIAAQLLSTDRA